MRIIAAFALLAVLACLPTQGQAESKFFRTSDGERLHYLEQGRGHTIVFVPGWDMPGWIFQRQIDDFSQHYHVVALDPRSRATATSRRPATSRTGAARTSPS